VLHVFWVFILSFLLFLLFGGALSPLWIRKEQTRAFHARLFKWFILGGGIVLAGVVIWTVLSDFLIGRTESRTLVTLALFLSIVLVGAGGNLLYELSIKRQMEQIQTKKLRQRYPDSPWRWSKRWRSNRIEYSDKAEIIFSYLTAAIIITGIALGFFLNTEGILKRFQENRMDGLVILYVLGMGVFFSVRFAVSSTNKWRKFKRSSFVMSTFPGVIGGRLEGEIQTRCRRVPCSGFDLKLSCVEMDISFRKSIHSVAETVLWESKKKVQIDDIRMGPCGISFPVSFNIPENTEETDTVSRDRRIHWILKADGAGDDHCLSAVFKVPVFGARLEHLDNSLTSSRS